MGNPFYSNHLQILYNSSIAKRKKLCYSYTKQSIRYKPARLFSFAKDCINSVSRLQKYLRFTWRFFAAGNQMLAKFGVTVEQLHMDAVENTSKNRPMVLEGLHEIMYRMTSHSKDIWGCIYK